MHWCLLTYLLMGTLIAEYAHRERKKKEKKTSGIVSYTLVYFFISGTWLPVLLGAVLYSLLTGKKVG